MTLQQVVVISVDNANPAVNVGETTVVKITNFGAITNPDIKVADTSIATAKLSITKAAGDITITGVKAGKTTLTISGDFAKSTVVNITVSEAPKQLSSIITDTELGELANNQEATIKAAVLAQNTNAKDGDFTIGNIQATGADLTGAGSYTGKVSVTFTIATPKVDPVLSKTSSTVAIGATDTITITNVADITNPKVTSATPATATATLSDGTITITGVAVGTVVVTVSGDNANNKTIAVTVTKIDIKTILTVTALGEIAKNDEATISAAVIAKNNKLKAEDFTVGSITTTTAVITSADNSNYKGTQNVSFTLPAPKVNITLDKEASTVVVGAKDTVKVTNIASIQGVKVVSGAEATATVSIDGEGNITVTGVKAGTTTATVSGTNANDKTFNITVNNKTITVDNANPSVVAGADKVIKITNFASLAGVKVAVTDTATATATLATTKAAGDITIHGVKAGSTKMSITADDANALEVTITVTAPPKIDITADNKTPTANVGKDVVVTITNASSITNLKATSKDTSIATATLAEGKVTIHGVKIGSTTMDLTGDNANTLTIPITISAIPLSDVLKVVALGELADNQPATIKAQAITANADTKLTADMFDIATDPAITETTAQANGKGNYSGNVALTFTVKAPAKKSFSAKKGK